MSTRRIFLQPSPLSQCIPFALPFFIFIIFLAIESFFPDQHYLFYPVKAGLVAVALAYFWRALPKLMPAAPLISIGVGILGIVLWVGLDPWAIRFNAWMGEGFNRVVSAVGLTSWQTVVNGGTPAGRNPFLLYPAGEAWLLFVLRVLGIGICVPIMEELFWRGFLMRWLIREDFTSVPLGQYQPFSFWVTTLLFALEHGSEWLLGLVVGALYGAWFIRTKSLGNVMLAHGATNFLLALYCLFSNDWHFLSALSPSTGAR